MLSEPFLSQQLQLANQQVKTWWQIDPRHNSLLRKKLMRANLKAGRQIKKQTLTIRFANRLSCNPTGTELQLVAMWGQEINELAETVYAIFCKEWELRGNKRTAIFVRAASAQLLQMIEQRGASAAYGAQALHRRRGGIGESIHGYYTDSARKLCEDWKEELDIEAEELDVQAMQSNTRPDSASKQALPSVQQGSQSVPSIATGRGDQGSRVLESATKPKLKTVCERRKSKAT